MATPFASRKYVDSSVAGLFDGVEYDTTNKRIVFKHGSTQKAYVDATAFIKDGMVSTVAIVTVPDDEEPSGVADGDYIKVTFNTDAGSDPIYIPLTDIFNPANYYDKTAADNRFVQKEAGKGLSTEDYTRAEKTKLEGVEAGAQANVIETVKMNGVALTPSGKAVDIPVPAAVTVVPPSQSATTGQSADAKATGDMLYTGFTPWKADSPLSGYVFESCVWKSSMSKWEVSWKAVMPGGTDRTTLADGAEDDVVITASSPLAYALSRHRITPTKTSQLENDGDGTSPFAKVSQLPDVSGKADASDVVLTPVYSQTPTFGEWTAPEGFTFVGIDETNPPSVRFTYGGEDYYGYISDMPTDSTLSITLMEEDIKIVFSDYDGGDVTFTRERTDVAGYTLGSQTTKPLQPQGNYLTQHQALPTATAQSLGMVKPDGTTITIADGVISAAGGGGGGGLWTGGNLTFSVAIANSYPEDATGYLFLIHKDGSTQRVTWNGSNLGPITYQDVSLAWLFPTGGLDGGGSDEGGDVTFTTGGSSISGALMPFYNSSHRNVFPVPCAFVLDGDATLAVGINTSCLIEGTAILLADGSSKPVEDIGYDDELAVWDFDEGRMASASPCWIKIPQRIDHAWRNRFSDGTEVWTTGTAAGHRFFSLDAGRFLYNTDCVGHRVYKFDGKVVKLESATLEHGDYEFYNLITAFHGNCFAGGVLAGYRYCNLYPIAGMKYVKDGRRLRSPEDYPSVPKEMFDGCRLAEVRDNPEDVVRYIMMEYVKIKSGADSARMLCRDWRQFVELQRADAPPGESWYLVDKVMPKPKPGAGKQLAFSYTVRDGVAYKEYFLWPDGQSLGPRVFSKLKVVAALMEAGVWAQVKAWIESNGLYDLYLAAQNFAEDNEYFAQGRTALQTALGWTDEQVEAVLAASVQGGI